MEDGQEYARVTLNSLLLVELSLVAHSGQLLLQLIQLNGQTARCSIVHGLLEWVGYGRARLLLILYGYVLRWCMVD